MQKIDLKLIFLTGIVLLNFGCNQKSDRNTTEEDPRLGGFKGKIAKTYEESVEDWPERVQAPDEAPNVMVILLDDVGFAQIGANGGLIETPNIDRLAANGLNYTNFHTTALCSPSRASIMAGRNHHSIGLGSHALTAMGFPGYNGMIPESAASGAKMLQENGFSTYALGKWDHTPLWEVNSTGPFNGWANEEGFDHFYGFMSADVHNFKPIMYNDHWPSNPSKGKEDYHINTDLANRAIYWLTAHKSVSPDRPFMMFYATPTLHAPHHASQEYLDMYKGKFDMGWDEVRRQILENQISLGIHESGTQLAELPDDIQAWVDVPEEKKKMYARQMEAAAAALTQADHEIGRVINALERIGELENTIIIVTSDNGSSGEGGLEGSHNEMLVLNGIGRTPHEENLRFYELWGTAETDNHYHAGWAAAGNTPFKYFKQTVHNGGIADPLVVHWPNGIKAKGELRKQYQHITDVVPTIMDVTGVGFQNEIDGVEQMPFDGVSFQYSFNDADAPTNHPVQYYEQLGSRAIYDNGWKAVSLHGGRLPWNLGGTFNFEEDEWELYDITNDPTEVNNLANSNPEKIEELKQKFDELAWKYNVYPLYDNVTNRLKNVTDRIHPPSETVYTYYSPGAEFIAESASPPLKNRNHSITAFIETDGSTNGVINCSGGYFAGYSLYVKNNILTYGYNFYDEKYYEVKANSPLSAGKHEIKLVYEAVKSENPMDASANIKLFVDGNAVGSGTIDHIVLGKYSLSEPFDVGVDNGGSVIRSQYSSPFRFTDTIDKVVIELE
ncbi:arylsulfatase [Eudoraea chungangensis]|uniref:arylsulfatase n=1 Tax=Eudoraea chungangensis TaxID=1481905 RepID=UPI0023EBC12F|nr:arylsulfatase [Eudoraea chungangensis]